MAAVAVCLVLTAVLAPAAEIQMADGTFYHGVTITRRDAVAFECFTQRGRTILPVIDIATIDGVRMSMIPDNAYPYVSYLGDTPRPTPTIPLALPPARKPTATAIPRAAAHTPTPSPRPTLRSAPTPAATNAPTAFPSPAVNAPQSDLPWILLTLAVFGALWGLSVWRVWRDQRRPGQTSPRFWLIVAAVLPVAGYLLYEIARWWKERRRPPPPAPVPLREFIFLDGDHRPIVIKAGEEASGLENAKGVLQDALLDRASDVHIEPGATECRVRYRIDGVMQPRMKFSAEEGLRVISALKSVAQLDIAERRKAQDGRFAGRSGKQEVDFRAATTPSVYGEKLVLRILDQKTGLRGLGELGMSEGMMTRFSEVIQSRSGMILATGPTGSGKTSSLYAALSQLDSVRLNIVTIEDPVEYELAGATQIPVNLRAGITYESGLRSILRQDPDVILVGEMRDLEAAQIALRSALSGQLMFTSLHTRDAVGTSLRLEEMGIERHLLASALFVVMAQRLVRVLCPDCREAYPCRGNELAEIGLELPAGEAIYRAVGCRRCESSGYIGRTGVFEMLILDDDLRQEINAGASEEVFVRVARTKGYRSYREDGAEKVLLGITSVDEVLKAI